MIQERVDSKMFCFQCEQTAHGTGCTIQGVCGKTADVANMQDLLIYQLKGISNYAVKLMEKGEEIDGEIDAFVEDSLFMTLTNVNFDPNDHVRQLKESQEIKNSLKERLGYEIETEYARYELPETMEEILEDTRRARIFIDEDLDPDIRSVRETIKYGLKGMSAYAHQARFLDYVYKKGSNFTYKALDAMTNDDCANSLSPMRR